VQGGRIVDLGPAAQIAEKWPLVPETDLGDTILAPGFVDAHCHLEWSLLSGLVNGAGFGAWLGAFLRLRPRMEGVHAVAARFGAVTAAEAGTTTVADSGPTGAGVAALVEVGLAGRVHLEAFGREVGAEATERATEIRHGIEALDAHSSSLVDVGLSPHAPYTVGPGLWAALAADAGLAQRPWATHLAESPDEHRLLSDGDGPLAELFAAAGLEPGRWSGPRGDRPVARVASAGGLRPGLVAAHCVKLGVGDAVRLAVAGVAVAHCPISNERLDCGRMPLELLRRAGVTVALGTDSPASAGPFDLRAEARVCREKHAVAGVLLTAREAVRMITLDGARALGLDHETGSLTIGRRADMVAVAPNPGIAREDLFAMLLDAGSRVVRSWVAGAPVVCDARVVTIDRDRVFAQAARARANLC
jgi:cytosine/adenosine deaminase-related metal-dependent hydrolase